MRIWFVEDDKLLGAMIAEGLESLGHDVRLLFSLEGFTERLCEEPPELMLLDLEIGDRDTADLIPFIHARHPEIPIIVASSCAGGDKIAHCYDSGISEYIKKPYDIREVDCVIRRVTRPTVPIRERVAFGDCQLDLSSGELFYKNRLVRSLSSKEFQALALLVERKGCLIQKDTLAHTLWQDDNIEDRLNMVVSRLRKLLSIDPTLHLENRKGQGYLLKEKGN